MKGKEVRREAIECPVCTEEMLPPKSVFQVFGILKHLFGILEHLFDIRVFCILEHTFGI